MDWVLVQVNERSDQLFNYLSSKLFFTFLNWLELMIINHFAYILMGSSKKTLKIKYGNKTNKIYFYCLYLNGTSFSIVFLLYSNSNFISDDCIFFF